MAETSWEPWIRSVCEAAGVDPALVDTREVRDLAQTVSTHLERPMAPVATFILGVALGQAARTHQPADTTALRRQILASIPLSETMRRRHARTITIPAIGEQGIMRLRDAKVCVVGAGGLGSPVLMYMAASGVGTITVIDHDLVEAHNLQRQVIHSTETLGLPKVGSASDRMLELNPDIAVIERQTLLTADNACDELRGHDLVVDATDNLAVRYAIADACEALDLPVVYGSISSTRAQVTVFHASRGFRLRDVFDPAQQPVGGIDDLGVLGPLVGMAGAAMATEVVNLVTGAGRPLLGRMLYLDALSGTPQVIDLQPTVIASTTANPGGHDAQR